MLEVGVSHFKKILFYDWVAVEKSLRILRRLKHALRIQNSPSEIQNPLGYQTSHLPLIDKIMSEENLIARIRKGDETKLMAIYRAYRNDFIYWAMRHFSCSEDVAKDVFQVSITIFYENVMSGKLAKLTSSVKTYLFAIGKNKLHENEVSRRRDLQIQEHFEEKIKDGFQMEAVEGETVEEKEAMYKLLENALAELGEPCRTVLEMYYYRDMSIEDISRQLNYKSSDSTKTKKYKCMTRLKKIMQGAMSSKF